MSRYFGAFTDRIVTPAPKVWPGTAGSIFVKIKPVGWGAGTVEDHVFFMYGFQSAAGRSILGFQRYSDHNIYAGWMGDGAHGGEQRIIVPDAGCFADGAWANHLFTWDDVTDHQDYYVDNVPRGARTLPLNIQALDGDVSSNVTIGNYNNAIPNADARGNLAFFARWSRVLTTAERGQLQYGAHPLDLPTGLVECIDLGTSSPEQDLQSPVTYAVTGTRAEGDPRRAPSVVRKWAKKFEPILLFHNDEKFFPIDPKWYLEQCALWPAVQSFTDKVNWGELPSSPLPHAPRLQKTKIAALAGEAFTGRKWLGASGSDFGVGTLPTQQAPPPSQEHFLEFAGWEPVVDPPNEVTLTSTNRHAALNPIEYAAPLSPGLAGASDSRPWYYVEHLDNADLKTFTEARRPNGLDLGALVANNPALGTPQVLLYNFLYPLHQEALENCEGAGEGQSFGTYAGEWSCVAVLMDSTGDPRFIGVTSRNVGSPSLVGVEDRRVGMTVFPWTAVTTVDTVGTVANPADTHPKIFVSLGTHGHYLSAGPHVVTPFSGGNNLSSGSCGVVEAADDVISGDITIPGEPSDLTPGWILVTKGILAALTLGLGMIWINLEVSDDRFGTSDQLVSPNATPTDQTGGPTFGKIIRPNGLAFAETASSAAVTDWQVDRFSEPDSHVYDYVVSRPAQVWWAPRQPIVGPLEGTGWFGRWGPRVTNDPFSRRAGGKCPDFLVMFLEALAIAFNSSP